MYSDEIMSSSLAKFLNNFDYVMIDTCSLMDEAFAPWMDALHNAKEYRKKGQQILVPRRCFDELKKHARQRHDDSRRIAAKRGLKILRKAKWSKLLTITKKDKNENFADNAIYVKASNDRINYKILVITQDRSLASDLRTLNELKSQMGKPLEVSKLVNGGRLVPNKGREDSPAEQKRGHFVPTDVHKIQEGNPVQEVISADARLSAVISNPNYPEFKKKADALEQLKRLEKLTPSALSSIKLFVPEAKLREIAQVPAPARPIAKPTPKPAPVVKDRLWYGTGKTMAEAFKDCANHYNILFREPTVTYFPEAHGPLDLTTADLAAIEEMGTPLLKGDEKVTFTYRGITLSTLETPEKFKAWIDVNNLPKAAPAKPKKTVKKPVEAKEKAEAPKEEIPQPEPKPKTRAKKAKPVAEETTPAPAEKPVEKEQTPQKEVKKAKKPAAKKAEEPAETPAEKPAPKTRKAPAKKAEEPAEEKAPAKPKKTVKKAAEAPAENEVVDEVLAKALKADHRMRTVLPNPNYPLEKKIADVHAHIEFLSSLTDEQRSKVGMGIDALNDWLAKNA